MTSPCDAKTSAKSHGSKNIVNEKSLLTPSLISQFKQLLLSIDTCLAYYFSSGSTDKIEVHDLEVRVARNSGLTLTIQHLQHIKFIWNDVFNLYIDQSGINLSIQQLPLNPNQRSEVFREYCQKKLHKQLESYPIENRTTSVKRSADKRLQLLRKSAQKPKLCINFDKQGSVLDRIKAKEKALVANKSISRVKEDGQQSHSRFVVNQLDAISRVLVTMATSTYSQQASTCVSIQEVSKVLSDSLKSKLSFEEVRNALDMLAQYIPDFCVLITVGSIQAVRIYRGWTQKSVQSYLLRSKNEKEHVSCLQTLT